MISRATLPVIAVLALTGASAGIFLGNAAVAEINPAYYNEPESRFHSELTPHQPQQVAGYRAGALSASNLEQAFGSGCVGCRNYPEEAVLVHRGSTGKFESQYAELAYAPAQAAAYEPAPSPEFAAVERYASYPVTEPLVAEAPVEAESTAAEPAALAEPSE